MQFRIVPYLTSGMVIELSAIFVHKTILRYPFRTGRNTCCCSSNVTFECNGNNCNFSRFLRKKKQQQFNIFLVRWLNTYAFSFNILNMVSISRIPGRKIRMVGRWRSLADKCIWSWLSICSVTTTSFRATSYIAGSIDGELMSTLAF